MFKGPTGGIGHSPKVDHRQSTTGATPGLGGATATRPDSPRPKGTGTPGRLGQPPPRNPPGQPTVTNLQDALGTPDTRERFGATDAERVAAGEKLEQVGSIPPKDGMTHTPLYPDMPTLEPEKVQDATKPEKASDRQSEAEKVFNARVKKAAEDSHQYYIDLTTAIRSQFNRSDATLKNAENVISQVNDDISLGRPVPLSDFPHVDLIKQKMDTIATRMHTLREEIVQRMKFEPHYNGENGMKRRESDLDTLDHTVECTLNDQLQMSFRIMDLVEKAKKHNVSVRIEESEQYYAETLHRRELQKDDLDNLHDIQMYRKQKEYAERQAEALKHKPNLSEDLWHGQPTSRERAQSEEITNQLLDTTVTMTDAGTWQPMSLLPYGYLSNIAREEAEERPSPGRPGSAPPPPSGGGGGYQPPPPGGGGQHPPPPGGGGQYPPPPGGGGQYPPPPGGGGYRPPPPGGEPQPPPQGGGGPQPPPPGGGAGPPPPPPGGGAPPPPPPGGGGGPPGGPAEPGNVTQDDLFVIQQSILKLTNKQLGEENQMEKSKLPPMKIKQFDGELDKWQSFYENFWAVVGRRNDIGDYQKLLNFRRALVENSKPWIELQGYEIEAASYPAQVNRIKTVFGDRRLLLGIIIRRMLFKQQATNIASASAMTGWLLSQLRAIEGLGLDVDNPNLSIFLLSIVETKFPSSILQFWEEEIRLREDKAGRIEATMEEATPPMCIQLKVREFLNFVDLKIRSKQVSDSIVLDGDQKSNAKASAKAATKSATNRDDDEKKKSDATKTKTRAYATTTTPSSKSGRTSRERKRTRKSFDASKNSPSTKKSSPPNQRKQTTTKKTPTNTAQTPRSPAKKRPAKSESSARPPAKKRKFTKPRRPKMTVNNHHEKGCTFCGDDHPMANCKKQKGMSVPEKWLRLRHRAAKAPFCFRCFDQGHNPSSCSQGSCGKDSCLKLHHPFLHYVQAASSARPQ
jgi:hypothetical protein